MILIMVIKIIFKIKIMKTNSIIEFMEIITINDNSHSNTKKTLMEKTKSNTYYIQTMKRPPCLICNVNITYIKIKCGMITPFDQHNSFCLKRFFLFQHCQLLLSPSRKSRYGHSEDSVRESDSAFALDLIVFVLFENCNVCFYSYQLIIIIVIIVTIITVIIGINIVIIVVTIIANIISVIIIVFIIWAKINFYFI